MEQFDLMEYIKRSKDIKCKKECYVRLKIKRLEDGRMVLLRNVMSKESVNGELSMGLILDKTGKPISTKTGYVGIMSIDDIEQMLDGCVVGIDASGLALDLTNYSAWLNLNLGVSQLEYQQILKEEAREFFLPMDSLSIEYLRTDKNYQKMRFARRLVGEADKIAHLNGLGYLCGLGVPFNNKFFIENKTQEDWAVVMQFKKTCEKRGIEFEPMGANVNLAVFYNRLGFDIYPIESGNFLIERKVCDLSPTKYDADFLKAESSDLDENTILIER